MKNEIDNAAAPREAEIAAAPYSGRRDRLRELIARRRLDAMLVSLAANRFYLSGFELHDPQFNESAGHLLIRADGEDWLATDSRYAVAAARIWPADRIFIYGSSHAADLLSLLRAGGPRVGIEPGGISWALAREFAAGAAALKVFLEPCAGLVEELRQFKEPCEVEAMARSFRLNHEMLAWLEGEIGGSAAFTEKELGWAIERYFRENGAQELAFASIVASGPNAALPHAIPGPGPIAPDCPLLVDVGCRVDNYCSDQTRTFWLGPRPSGDFARTLALVQEAQAAALAIMRPGVPCAKVYEAARNVFVRAGVEKAFNHGLGHGVGLETHEAPSLSPKSSAILQKGMAVTVEPGLYYPEWGGARWEHTVLVEDDGVRIF